MAVTITQGTTTGIATDLVGTNHYQYVKLDVGAAGAASAFTGTIAAVTNLAGGTITALATGTVNTIGTLGSITNLGSLTNAGTIKEVANLAKGTITALETGTLTGGTLTNLISGTINSVGELVKGTITNVGTLVGLGTITNIGTVGTITGATINTGSLTNIANLLNGTVVVPTGTVTTGSLTNVANVLSITAGTQNTLGTVGAVNSIVAGTQNTLGTVGVVNNVAGGTIQLNPVPTPTMLTFGTLGTAGGSFFATLSAASGAGTKHYISGIDVVMDSGTADVRILAGSAIQGTGVLAAGKFPAGGGISKQFTPVFATGTNSELIYHFVGAGTAYIVINYWKGA